MFSLEQPKEQIFERMLALEAEVSLEDIHTRSFVDSYEALGAVERGEVALSAIMENIFIDDRASVTASYIASVSRQKKLEWGKIGLIVVDYLHIMTLNDKILVEALGDAVKDLRSLGKELHCPVLLLAQLSRNDTQQQDQRKVNRRPELSDLRSSGEIEQSADVVIFLYRESYYGSTGSVAEEDIVEVSSQESPRSYRSCAYDMGSRVYEIYGYVKR